MCFNHKNFLFNIKKSNKCTIALCFLSSSCRYIFGGFGSCFFWSGFGSWFFFSAGRGSKEPPKKTSYPALVKLLIVCVKTIIKYSRIDSVIEIKSDLGVSDSLGGQALNKLSRVQFSVEVVLGSLLLQRYPTVNYL